MSPAIVVDRLRAEQYWTMPSRWKSQCWLAAAGEQDDAHPRALQVLRSQCRCSGRSRSMCSGIDIATEDQTICNGLTRSRRSHSSVLSDKWDVPEAPAIFSAILSASFKGRLKYTRNRFRPGDATTSIRSRAQAVQSRRGQHLQTRTVFYSYLLYEVEDRGRRRGDGNLVMWLFQACG